MGRAPCCDKTKVKRGPWSPEEDSTLKNYVENYGTGGNWIALPHKAGLKRCGKSCRLRWLNYLRPDIKHGGFTEEEDNIILTLYSNIGSRWSVIASQLQGRTDNDVKNYWNTKLKKKLLAGATTALNATLLTNTNSINFASTSMHFGLPPLTKVQPDQYGNSAPSIASSDAFPKYQMHMINSYTADQFVPEMFCYESTDNLPLPKFMKVEENSTSYHHGFTTSSSQEISSLSPSYSLGTSTYASNWFDNAVGEEVGHLMELGSKPSYGRPNCFDHQEKLISAEELDLCTTALGNYSYSGSLLANISETEPSQGLHPSNISN